MSNSEMKAGKKHEHDLEVAVTLEELQLKLKRLHKQRRDSPTRVDARKRSRGRLKSEERDAVLKSTDGKCHICGGVIAADEKWQTDHVLPHSSGGAHASGNYLPAHSLCNNYRWDYLPDEFQLILKLGVWIRTQIERGTSIGTKAGQGFALMDWFAIESNRLANSNEGRTAAGRAGRAKVIDPPARGPARDKACRNFQSRHKSLGGEVPLRRFHSAARL